MAAPPISSPMVLVMVGLPARGKTYLAYKLSNYLSWLGYATRVFNVGNYRRSEVGRHMPASFFDPDNPEGVEARRRVAMHALDDLVAWTDGGGNIGIYDATNSTQARRVIVRRRCEERGLRVLFIESICNLPEVIEANIKETKLNAPDYEGMSGEEATADFRARIALYEGAYEPLNEDDSSHIKIIDVGRQVIANRLHGYLAGRLLNFVMNLHITPRRIWLTRHGESLHNAAGLIGGDAPLSARGEAYARELQVWIDAECPGDVTVWTSTLLRTIQTAHALDRPALQIRALDEINAGVCDGMSYARIEAELPEEFAARRTDKLGYRYPRGESYQDVIRRLEPVIIELERQRDPVLIVAHQAVLRALYGYIQGLPLEDVPHLPIPLHTVIELIPKAYGADERRIRPGATVSVEATHPDLAGPEPDYCCAILVGVDGRFLLERRPSHKSAAPGRITCFGGLREPDEHPAACMRRELVEELGFVPAALSTVPAVALHVDGELVAWFYTARLGPAEPAPRLEPDVDLVQLSTDRLDHPDLSSWHAPILRWWSTRG